jgi:hypothetical protein
LSALILGALSCDRARDEARKKIEPVYDEKTGRLTLLKYDSNGNGKVDTWSYMDGARVIRIEIDKDEDGKIDRWEYYGLDQKMEKVGFSRANDGTVDAWTFSNGDGSIAKIEISSARDGHVDRTEYYEQNLLTRAEEDSDRDGKADKWETYDPAGHLTSVAFDTRHRGVPDRRLVYDAAGGARLEIDEHGDGHFVAAPPAREPRTKNREP